VALADRSLVIFILCLIVSLIRKGKERCTNINSFYFVFVLVEQSCGFSQNLAGMALIYL